MPIHTPSHAPHAGFSLVEVMVGLTVALLGILVIFQVFAVSQNYKKAATSGGDAQQSGALALYELQRTIQVAGYGIAAAIFDDSVSCTDAAGSYGQVNGHREGAPGVDVNFWLAPVVINNGASGAPDSITVLYGNSAASVSMTDISASTATSLTVTTGRTYGFFLGDIFVALQNSRGCMMGQVTANDGVSLLTHLAAGTYLSPYTSQNEISAYNKPGGMVGGADPNFHNYTAGAKLLNLGPNPRLVTYSIANDTLQANGAGVFGGTIEDIAGDLVNLQAQYGVDTNNDGAVDTYVDSTNAVPPMLDWNGDGAFNQLDWQRVRTIRLALLARGVQRVNECDSQQPTWAGGNFDMSAVANWQCYRYRVFETVVPLRNLAWNPT